MDRLGIVENCLYVGNLPSSATDAELKAKFEQFGSVLSAVIATDSATGRSKRFAHIEMATRAEALAAIRRLNMTLYDDVIMSVSRVRADRRS
ncbi:MAG TPA: RNA-binding protein [Gammaproteobacteria bacterium]|nr:RNA-binding protein [Gammaproteobacteria bacterium]